MVGGAMPLQTNGSEDKQPQQWRDRMTDQLGEQAAFVAASKYRYDTAKTLDESAATPKAISEQCGHQIAHVSRTLSELTENGIVTLIVPEDTRKGRIYALTEEGEEVVNNLADVAVHGEP